VRATENRTSMSLFFKQGSLESTQPCFLSQVQASLTDETGLAEALSCASKSALGTKYQLPSKEALVLDSQEVLQGLIFALEKSPIMGNRADEFERTAEKEKVTQRGIIVTESQEGDDHESGRPVHTGYIKAVFRSSFYPYHYFWPSPPEIFW
jgi:hypothetical protein